MRWCRPSLVLIAAGLFVTLAGASADARDKTAVTPHGSGAARGKSCRRGTISNRASRTKGSQPEKTAETLAAFQLPRGTAAAPDLRPDAALHLYNRKHGIAVYVPATGKARAVLEKSRRLGLKSLPCSRTGDGRIVVQLDQIVVQASAGTGINKLKAIARELGVHFLRRIGTGNLYLLQAGTNDVHRLCRALEALPEIDWAEIDRAQTPRKKFLPSDNLFTNQWELYNTGQGGGATNRDIYAETAWDITRGTAAVVVAVLDDGFDLDHPDLSPVVYSNTAEVLNGADDDGNGYADDITGWDVYDNDNDPRPAVADENHGTAVLGPMIAAANGTGVVGIAHGCRFLPLRVFGSLYTDSDVAEALDYASATAAVISISYYLDPSATILSALRRATALGRNGKGCLVCCALGNDGVLRRYSRDASAAPEALTVSGLSNYDRRSWFADFGPPAEVMVAAGGGSLALTTTDRLGNDGYTNTDYFFEWEGTSASAPIVAGVAALIFSAHPDWTALQARRALVGSCDPVDWQAQAYTNAGKSLEYGFGRVNARAALEYDQSWNDPYEPDNSSFQAALISDGRLQFRSLSAGDTDWVWFQLPNTGDLCISVVGSTGVSIRLYDSNLTQVAQVDPSPFTILTVNNAVPGIYYARLTATGVTEVAQYGLHLGILNQVDTYEPDNSSTSAAPIQPRTRQHHTFYPAGDEDWASFALTNAAYVEILTLGEVDGDTILWLYDSGLNVVASNDDDVGTYYSYIAEMLTPGQYYIRVKEYNDDPLEAYSIILEIHQPDPYEPNDSITQATWIASGQRLSMTLFPSGDVDWVKFAVTNPSAMLLMTDSADPYLGGDTYLMLYDQNTNLLAENDDGNNHYFSAIYTGRLEAGTYYARVEGVGGYSTIETAANYYIALDLFEARTRITNITRNSAGVAINWPGDAAWYYQVDELSGTNWIGRTNLEGRVGANRWVDTSAGTAPTTRWYRLLAH